MALDIGNLWIRQNSFERADEPPVDAHSHEEDHVWILTHGGARLENWKPDGSVDNEATGDYYIEHKPVMINIPKENRHKVSPLLPNTEWLCVFSKYLPDGKIARGK